MTTSDVEVALAEPAPTLVVKATTTWPEFRTLWGPMLDQVWSRLRQAGITSGCRNVMLYLDDQPHVEVGVICDHSSLAEGEVVASHLPAGRVASATHTGAFADLGLAHDAVARWIAEHGEQAAGPRWEVYGPHDADPERTWVRVSYLLVEA